MKERDRKRETTFVPTKGNWRGKLRGYDKDRGNAEDRDR